MKQTTLEDLYYGNINPNEISFVRGSEYGKCFDKATELSKSVCSQLNAEYKNYYKIFLIKFFDYCKII